MTNPFSFSYLRNQLHHAIDSGYQFISCSDYFDQAFDHHRPCVVLRVDIDENVERSNLLMDIFKEFGIRATFFIRLHASYNPFQFQNYMTIRRIRDENHEIGYHSEVLDQEMIWGEDSHACLRRDISVLELMFDIKIRGVASHGGRTGVNNLDFWSGVDPSTYGLDYEAYDQQESFGLFGKSLYISDSEWTNWKCYDRGILLHGDRRSLIEHLADKPMLVYMLIHPETYFGKHVYESHS